MNKENLEALAKVIEQVPQEDFDMRQMSTCVVGHGGGAHGFLGTKVGFLDATQLTSEELSFVIAALWEQVDNTPTGAAKRIRHLINHGLPENWRDQMTGEAPISYL